MPAQISILDLLRTSPIHQEILDKALKEGHVPTDINTTQFETLVGHLSAACALSFKESDIPDVAPDHTLPLRIAVMVRDFAIKRVLVDNGSALNLCTLKFIKKIGFTEADIQHEMITIKAYDNLERTSEGTITLPIQLGPAMQDTVCHVVDLDLPFNILLGRPWIHSIKAVPSTYHQCIKFPHQGTEVTIHADPNPFAYCRAIEASFPHSTHCPGTDIGTSIASSSRSHCDPETILSSTLSSVKINNQGCGEYSLSDAFAVGALPRDPHTQGR
ncbi:retropepsin-like aspartic protease, partial [[Clostridium] innocuum]|uniref:retropepsin-like aspartic protease n=1 Tax=Clostridium innocuum TaxID=1522 RepID=UPI0005D24F72